MRNIRVINNLVFYNHYGNGDIFESREFVKEICRRIPHAKAYYAHSKNPRVLLDLPYLHPYSLEGLDDRIFYKLDENNNLFINTWIGRDSSFVLPGIGCTVEKLHEMYNMLLNNFGMRLEKNTYDYIPSIDYSYYDVGNIIKFIDETRNIKKVLICNGPVHSNQASNFDFEPIIDEISSYKTDILFITTNGTNVKRSNVMDFLDIINKNLGCDLNEISFLSLYCDIIIGRCSGPHVFSQVRENWFNPYKMSISFTYTYEGSHFVLSDRLPMKKLWSNTQNPKIVSSFIKGVL